MGLFHFLLFFGGNLLVSVKIWSFISSICVLRFPLESGFKLFLLWNLQCCKGQERSLIYFLLLLCLHQNLGFGIGFWVWRWRKRDGFSLQILGNTWILERKCLFLSSAAILLFWPLGVRYSKMVWGLTFERKERRHSSHTLSQHHCVLLQVTGFERLNGICVLSSESDDELGF